MSPPMIMDIPHKTDDATRLRMLAAQYSKFPRSGFWKRDFDFFSSYFKTRYGGDLYVATVSDYDLPINN